MNTEKSEFYDPDPNPKHSPTFGCLIVLEDNFTGIAVQFISVA